MVLKRSTNLKKILFLTIIAMLMFGCKAKNYNESKVTGQSKEVYIKEDIELPEDKVAGEFIGVEFSNYPEGIKKHQGRLVKDNYPVIYVSKENVQMLWLEKFFIDSSGNQDKFIVLDVVVSPEASEKYTFATDGHYLNDMYENKIVTLVEKTDEDYLNVRHAWRINLEKGKFDKINVDGIKCKNTTFKY